jgi:hypothetical protein
MAKSLASLREANARPKTPTRVHEIPRRDICNSARIALRIGKTHVTAFPTWDEMRYERQRFGKNFLGTQHRPRFNDRNTRALDDRKAMAQLRLAKRRCDRLHLLYAESEPEPARQANSHFGS